MGFDVANGYPMVEALLLELHLESGATMDGLVKFIHLSYQTLGPYDFCATTLTLVNNSAEEFSIQWMEFYNKYTGSNFY